MKIGAYYPQTEIGVNLETIVEFAQAVEAMGIDSLVLSDRVLATSQEFSSTVEHGEYFVHAGLLAGVTSRLEIVSGVLLLPERQTVLVAQQAALADVLSGGRLRLGVGLGVNPLEYEALGTEWSSRARRLEEQVAVLRALWTSEQVSFEGEFHKIAGGINPRPVQRPIPIWFGGAAEAMVERAARIGDGLMLLSGADDAGKATIERLQGYVEAEGRSWSSFGIEGRLHFGGPYPAAAGEPRNPAELQAEVRWWRDSGATHLVLNSRWSHRKTLEEHLDAVRRMKDLVDGS